MTSSSVYWYGSTWAMSSRICHFSGPVISVNIVIILAPKQV